MSPGPSWKYTATDDGRPTAHSRAKHYTSSVGAQMGMTQRVIIVDGGDFTNFEWKFGEGITYPPRPVNNLKA